MNKQESELLNALYIKVICDEFHINSSEIKDIVALKNGMTNKSFLFTYNGKRYIMRIPGKGTEYLINRKNEADVYKVINNKNICDNIVYINPENGYKITEYLEETRVCNPMKNEDVILCMNFLRHFHDLNLSVSHEFDIFSQIKFYESLRGETQSAYKDYEITKQNIFSLRAFIDKNIEKKVLTHMDAVADNFLFTKNNDLYLIDWEYAGMQDPHVDIAMFCIYSLYNKRQIDNLISIYFKQNCKHNIRIKIYCYIAACGLLWSNWCEYKRILGVEFGDYSLQQYCYAKEYYRIVQSEFNKLGGTF